MTVVTKRLLTTLFVLSLMLPSIFAFVLHPLGESHNYFGGFIPHELEFVFPHNNDMALLDFLSEYFRLGNVVILSANCRPKKLFGHGLTVLKLPCLKTRLGKEHG